MSAYKKLNSQDTYITTYTAQKQWAVSGSEYAAYGITKLTGTSGSGVYYPNNLDRQLGQYKRLVYNSVHHLYYSNYIDGELNTTSSFDNYRQSSFTPSGSNQISKSLTVFSLPRDIIGTHIEPGSFKLIVSGDETLNYMFSSSIVEASSLSYAKENGYNDYVETFSTLLTFYGTVGLRGNEDFILSEEDYVQETIAAGGEYLFTIYPTPEILDDKEGNLYLSGTSPRKYVGKLIYTHGIVIITEELIAEYFNDYFNADLEWKSNQPIYTHNYHCKLKESEYNITTNPSAVGSETKQAYYNDGEVYSTDLKVSNSTIKDRLLVPEFQPYITTVGLYNDTNELIAVAKLGQPVPKPANTEMTLIVRIDI